MPAKSLIVVVLSALPFCAPLHAATVSTTQPTPEVLALVEILSDDSSATRQSAEASLDALGTGIEPQLRLLLAGDLPPETRVRLNRIIADMPVNPSFITLHFKNAPMIDVLDEFAVQSGADMGVHSPLITDYARGRRLTINVERVTFWEALREIDEAADLQPISSSSSRLILQPGNSPRWDPIKLGGRAKVAGPFFIAPVGAGQSHELSYSGSNPAQVFMSLNLQVLTEPKIRILSPLYKDWLIDAVDDNGNSLADPRGQFPQILPWCFFLDVGLKVPANIGKKIARLRGRLHTTVATKSDIVEITDLAHFDHVTRSFLGNAVTLRKRVHPNGDWDLIFSSDALTLDPLDDHSWSKPLTGAALFNATLDNSWALYDESGNEINLVLEVESRSGHELWVFTHRAGVKSDLPEPRSLRWDIPAVTRDLIVPFEINDLSLPSAN